MRITMLCAAAALLGFGGCQEPPSRTCVNFGCEAASVPVGDVGIEQGLAGAGASHADSCTGCCDCDFTDHLLFIVPGAEDVIDDDDARALFLAHRARGRLDERGALRSAARCRPRAGL